MSGPSDIGLAEFITLSGASHKVRASLDDFLEFACGGKDVWKLILEPDEHGTVKTIYLPFHSIEQLIWHDQQLARKRRAKGKK